MDLNRLFQFITPVREAGSKTIDVNFCDNEKLILQKIKEHDTVLGCTPWLTNKNILNGLSMLEHGACIVTDKNAMAPYVSGYLKKFRKIKALEFEVADLPNNNFYFDQLVIHGKNSSAVRVFGLPTGTQKKNPYLHYKFLIFCDIEKDSKTLLHPKMVLAGSFNLSNNATYSREMILSIYDEHAVNCFFYEWSKAFMLSENVNRYSPTDLDPEFISASSAQEIIDKLDAENIWIDNMSLVDAGLSRLYNGAD